MPSKVPSISAACIFSSHLARKNPFIKLFPRVCTSHGRVSSCSTTTSRPIFFSSLRNSHHWNQSRISDVFSLHRFNFSRATSMSISSGNCLSTSGSISSMLRFFLLYSSSSSRSLPRLFSSASGVKNLILLTKLRFANHLGRNHLPRISCHCFESASASSESISSRQWPRMPFFNESRLALSAE